MKIYLVNRPSLDNEAINRFLEDERQRWHRTPETNPGEDLIELAGRVCYMSFGNRQSIRSNQGFLENLIAKGHESVLEHAAWTFIVIGVTRSFTHQFVRHRIGFSYSQLSQQYHSQEFSEFIAPIGLENSRDLKVEWEKAIEASQRAYSNIKNILETSYNSKLKEKGEHNQKEIRRSILSTARSVLPNCIETKIVFSANARSIRHFLKLRGGIIGDIEMRCFCVKLLLIMKREAPRIFSDFIEDIHVDGYPIIIHRNRKNIN